MQLQSDNSRAWSHVEHGGLTGLDTEDASLLTRLVFQLETDQTYMYVYVYICVFPSDSFKCLT